MLKIRRSRKISAEKYSIGAERKLKVVEKVSSPSSVVLNYA